jgi:hypothetical protein
MATDDVIQRILNPGGVSAARAASRQQAPYVNEEEERSLIGNLRDKTLTTLGVIGNTLSLPLSSVMDVASSVVTGQIKNPFDQYLTPFSGENRTTGQDLLEQTNIFGPEPSWGKSIAGFGLEVAADPLTYLTLGGSALGKAGQAAKKAGLLDEAQRVTRLKTGAAPGTVGPRQARLSTSLQDIAQYSTGDTRRRAQDLLDRLTPEEAAAPLGGMVGFGLPFAAPRMVTGTGARAQTVARAMDTAGRAVRFGKIPGTDIQNPLGAILGAFDARSKGAKEAAVAESTGRLFDELPKSAAAIRASTANQATYLEDLVKNPNNPSIPAVEDYLSKRRSFWGPNVKAPVTDEEKYMELSDAIREGQEGIVDLNDMPEELRWISAQMQSEADAMPGQMRRAGGRVSELADKNLYAARYKSQGPKAASPRDIEASTFDPSQGFRRQDFLRDIDGGTVAFRRKIVMDPELQRKLADKANTVDDIAEYLRNTHSGWLADDYTSFYRTGKDKGKAYVKKGRYQKMARMLYGTEPEVLKRGFFGNSVLSDHMMRRMSHVKATSTLKNMTDLLSSKDTAGMGRYIKGEGSWRSSGVNVGGPDDSTMKLSKFLKMMDLPEFAIHKELKTDTLRKGGILKVLSKNMGISTKDLRKARIDKRIADDLYRVHKAATTRGPMDEILEMTDSATNMMKTFSTTIRPGFHVRNLASGWTQNAMLGMWDKQSAGWSMDLLQGRTMADSRKIEWVGRDYARRAMQAGWGYDDIATKLRDAGYSNSQVASVIKSARRMVPKSKRVKPLRSASEESFNLPSASVPAKVDIDGVARPAVDSTGSPIHTTEEGVRNFWKNFKDSKVVDAEGKPLVVYHGTPESGFNKFSTENKTVKMDEGFMGKGHYFTTSPDTAKWYSMKAGMSPGTYPVYLSVKNPVVMSKKPLSGSEIVESIPDYPELQKRTEDLASQYINSSIDAPASWASVGPSKEQEISSAYSKAFSVAAKEQGYDGSVFTFRTGEKEVVAFDPTQIKSATGNRGTFDAAETDIRRMPMSPDDLNKLPEPVVSGATTADAFTAPETDLWKASKFAKISDEHAKFSQRMDNLVKIKGITKTDANLLRLMFAGASQEGMARMNMPAFNAVNMIDKGRAAGVWIKYTDLRSGKKSFEIKVSKKRSESQSGFNVLLHELGHMAHEIYKTDFVSKYGDDIEQLFKEAADSGVMKEYMSGIHGKGLGDYLSATFNEQFAQLFADSIVRRRTPPGALAKIVNGVRDWIVGFLERLKITQPIPKSAEKRIDEIVDALLGYDGKKLSDLAPPTIIKGSAGKKPKAAPQPTPQPPTPGPVGPPVLQPPTPPPPNFGKTDPYFPSPGSGDLADLDDAFATRIIGQRAYADGVIGSVDADKAADVAGTPELFSGTTSEILGSIPRVGNKSMSPTRVAKKAFGMEEGTNLNPVKTRGVGGAMTSTFGPVAAGEEVGAFVDGLTRIQPYIALLRKGYEPEVAAKKVVAAQVAYSNRNFTPFELKYMRRLLPFYKFSRSQIPFQMKQLMEKPGGAQAQLFRALNQAQSQGELAPDYVRDTASIPVSEQNPILQALIGAPPEGTDRYISGLGLMAEDLLSVGPGVRGTGQEFLSRLNPLLKGPLEYTTNQSFFQAGPEGGRPLDELDPLMGRILANLSGQKDAVQLPQILEVAAANSPIASLLTTARTLTDPRKAGDYGALSEASPVPLPGVPALLNTLTGLRVTDVSPGSKDAIVRDLLESRMKGAGAKAFERVYFSKEQLAQMSPEDRQVALELQGLANVLAKRTKERAAERKKNEANK